MKLFSIESIIELLPQLNEKQDDEPFAKARINISGMIPKVKEFEGVT